MVKYHFFKTRKEAEKKQKQIMERGFRATILNFGKPSRKGFTWRLHEYKRKLPKNLRPKKRRK